MNPWALALPSVVLVALLAPNGALAAGMPGGTTSLTKPQERQKSTQPGKLTSPPAETTGKANTSSPKVQEGKSGKNDHGDDGDDETPWSRGAELDLNSRYLWRGVSFSSGPVLQPTAWLSWREWTAAVWLNVMLTDAAPCPLTIVVPTLSYLWTHDDFSLGAEAMLMWDTSGLENNPTAMTLGLEAAWAPGIVEVTTGHYINVLTDPGAYYGELALGVAGKSDPWLLSFGLRVGLGNRSFRHLYLDELPDPLAVVDGSLRLQYAWANFFYASVHAETYTIVNRPPAPGQSSLLANFGLTLGANF